MADELRTREQKAVYGYLDGMVRRKEITASTRDHLTKNLGPHQDEYQAIGAVHAFLEGEGAGLKLPGDNDRKPEHPLQSFLRRLPLKSGHADRVFEEFLPELGLMPPASLASAALRRLNRTEHADRWDRPAPPPPPEQAKIEQVLHDMRRDGQLGGTYSDAAALAAKWAGESGGGPFRGKSMVEIASVVEGRVRGYSELWPNGRQPQGIAPERRQDYVQADMDARDEFKTSDAYKQMAGNDRYQGLRD